MDQRTLVELQHVRQVDGRLLVGVVLHLVGEVSGDLADDDADVQQQDEQDAQAADDDERHRQEPLGAGRRGLDHVAHIEPRADDGDRDDDRCDQEPADDVREYFDLELVGHGLDVCEEHFSPLQG